MYIAGTRDIGDVIDDLRIPMNDVENTTRYRSASFKMKGVSTVVGHSLGGSVALALARHFSVSPVTYGAPVVDFGPGVEHRHRHWFDPVAIFDFAAQTTFAPTVNPHSFS